MRSAPAPLPVIQVTRACDKSWQTMSGDDRKRFCAHCGRLVHNLSAMTDADAAMVCAMAGPLYVRYEIAPDGSVKTLDYEKRDRGRERITDDGSSRVCWHHWGRELQT
jgi:hypothetical protein